MIVLLVVDATIFLSFAFSHLHVSMRAEVCPPPGAALPALAWTLAASALAAVGSVSVAAITRLLERPRNGSGASRLLLTSCALTALLASAGAFAALVGGHLEAGLAPRADAWSATLAAMLSYQGLHLVIALLMAAYLCAL